MTDDRERAPTANAMPAATTRVEPLPDLVAHPSQASTDHGDQPPIDALSQTAAWGGSPQSQAATPRGKTAAAATKGLGHSTEQVPGIERGDYAGSLPRPQDRSAVEAPDDRQLLTDRDQQLTLAEHRATVGRLRRLIPVAIALWLGFFFVDFVLATWVVPGPLWPYLVLRLIGVLPLAATWMRLRHERPPSPGELAVFDVVMTGSSAGLLAGMCLLSGGLTSPFATYIAMVIAGRAAVWPNPWRVGLRRLGVAAVASPVVVAAALPFSPSLRAQLSDAHAVATYFFFLMLIFGAWALLVIGSHNAWTLRRQVFSTRSIGRYKLDKRIGRGGMGEVWVAWHEQLRRHVALKILRPESGTDPSAVARFEREVMATAALTHPHTVRIFDHGVTDDGLWYYAMELLHGEDLQRRVARDGPLPAATAITLIGQAAKALAEAHRGRIIHRDIKPENLFIAEIGGEPEFIKILDFGIARVTESNDTRLTGTGWVAGTPAYLSPEAAEGRDVEPTGDVYGLGAVLYFTVTGTPPFSADNAMHMLQLHVRGNVELPSQRLGRQVPPALEQLIMRCLEKSPAARYAHAGELAEALAALDIGPSPRQTLQYS